MPNTKLELKVNQYSTYTDQFIVFSTTKAQFGKYSSQTYKQTPHNKISQIPFEHYRGRIASTLGSSSLSCYLKMFCWLKMARNVCPQDTDKLEVCELNVQCKKLEVCTTYARGTVDIEVSVVNKISCR